jgi:hypothetical protein
MIQVWALLLNQPQSDSALKHTSQSKLIDLAARGLAGGHREAWMGVGIRMADVGGSVQR